MNVKKLLSASLIAISMASISGIAVTQEAQAAGCYASNLTSTHVKNNGCKLGAYAYRSGSTWYQSGNWVGAGKYSNNWYQICYAFPGMLIIN